MASAVFSLVTSSSVTSLGSAASLSFDKRLKLTNKTSYGYGVRTINTRRYNLSSRAMDSSGPASGSIDSTLMTTMAEKIKEKLSTNDVAVSDAYGDGRHVSIEVISSEFEGKSSVNRQRMVYQAIWEELQTTVHAVDSMRTWTPQEAAEAKSKESL